MISIRLCPNVSRWPKGIRRATMLVVWPLVIIEIMANGLIGFPMEFYRCWNAERYLNG